MSNPAPKPRTAPLAAAGLNPHPLMSGRRMREIRRKRALTIADLGRWLMLAPGNSYNTVHDWETESRAMSGPVSCLMEAFDAGWTPPHIADGRRGE